MPWLPLNHSNLQTKSVGDSQVGAAASVKHHQQHHQQYYDDGADINKRQNKEIKRNEPTPVSRQALDETYAKYTSALRGIKPDKPIINNLSYLAEGNKNVAAAIVRSIEDHLVNGASNQRLATLFLMDSVMKNVKQPYIDLFSRKLNTVLPRAFHDCIPALNESDKKNFLRVIRTWPPQVYSKEFVDRLEASIVSYKKPVTSNTTAIQQHSTTSNPASTTTTTTNQQRNLVTSPPQILQFDILKPLLFPQQLLNSNAGINGGSYSSSFEHRHDPQKVNDIFAKSQNGPLSPTSKYDALIKNPSHVAYFLYGALSKQCTTCGLRFSGDPRAQERMNLHLDNHYRTNRRLREKTRKVLSRDWFQLPKDWINNDSSSSNSSLLNQSAGTSGAASLFFESNSTTTKVAECESLDNSSHHVPVNSVKSSSCFYCNEKFDTFYDDEKDVWCYKNAVVAEEDHEIIVAHPTCIVVVSNAHESVAASSDVKSNNETNQMTLYSWKSEKPIVVRKQLSSSSSAFCPYCKRKFSTHNFENDNDDDETGIECEMNDRTSIYSSVSASAINVERHKEFQYFLNNKHFKYLSKRLSVKFTALNSLYHSFRFPSIQQSHPLLTYLDGDFSDSAYSSEFIGLASNSFNQGYYNRFFMEEQMLGRGLRGFVYRCQHVLDSVPLGHYAVKKVPVGDNHEWLVRMLKEVNILERLSHPNIIDYKHSWLEIHQLTSHGPPVPVLFILMEYAQGGTLEDLLEKRKKGVNEKPLKIEYYSSSSTPPPLSDSNILSESEIHHFLVDILNGLDHLHRHGIIHRDVKPSNVLVQYVSELSFPRLLLTDFGECCDIASTLQSYRERSGATGTLEYMAPELLEMDKNGKYLNSFNTKSDIWSLGILLYHITYGRVPFSSVDVKDLREEVLNFNQSSLVSQLGAFQKYSLSFERGLKHLLSSMLQMDPNKRPNTAELLVLCNQVFLPRISNGMNNMKIEVEESKKKKLIIIILIAFQVLFVIGICTPFLPKFSVSVATLAFDLILLNKSQAYKFQSILMFVAFLIFCFLGLLVFKLCDFSNDICIQTL